ncbi:magnesium transporter [Taklimakanibacter lacteus]|uniref:magnesium transporter n=1 Tax=Taklimakanibacter lacteus TaxID=2268456 RepID=UPI000E6706CB
MTTVKDMMQEPVLVLAPENTVAQAIAAIRAIPRERIYTYPMVADRRGRLVGLCVMRDLILADAKAKIAEVMLTKVLALPQGADVHDALNRIKGMEIPEYPVIARNGRLRGVVRAARLHEIEEARLAATPGRMVGVDEGETVATPFLASIRSRLPWLMINLVTAFAAGLVVGHYQDTIDRVVLLAAFLPVLAGQSGNTGAQALAITLRTLERSGTTDFYSAALWKEIRLGLVHGVLTGIVVGAVIYIVAALAGDTGPEWLALIVFIATILSVLVSGLCGASVPVVLKKMGADPATASSIILTTITDIVSMGSMLMLASMLIGYLT